MCVQTDKRFFYGCCHCVIFILRMGGIDKYESNLFIYFCFFFCFFDCLQVLVKIKTLISWKIKIEIKYQHNHIISLSTFSLYLSLCRSLYVSVVNFQLLKAIIIILSSTLDYMVVGGGVIICYRF